MTARLCVGSVLRRTSLGVAVSAWSMLAGCGGGGNSATVSSAEVSPGAEATAAQTIAPGPAVAAVPATAAAPSADAVKIDPVPAAVAAPAAAAVPPAASAAIAPVEAPAVAAVTPDPMAAPSPSPAVEPAASTAPAATVFGTYTRPYAADSPWNSKPLDPVFGSATVPSDAYKPVISSGAFSTAFYQATASDGPATFVTFNKDAEQQQTIVLPHFPIAAQSASGSDGHLDVLDATTGIVHSFWQARKQSDGQWTAVLYAWSRIDGRGFGDPAHYYQGARAAAVPTSAGIIRAHEIDDGKDQYEHALAMSLTYSALSAAAPGYVFPATSADFDYTANKGQIPEGALLMLPPTFDLSKISNPAIRKVAKTLKSHGAYVVDRNTGTPFAIYQEIGTRSIAGWREAADTEQIQRALRPVTATRFTAGDGTDYAVSQNLNLMSMRGPWGKSWDASIPGTFNTYANSYDFEANTKPSEQNRWPSALPAWSVPKARDVLVFTPKTTGNARLRLQVFVTVAGKMVNVFDSGQMASGSASFTWPQGGYMVYVASYGGGGAKASVSGTLIKQSP